ncbi:MAG: hypothetical protein R3D98_03665 [Candidatus Krumholzibacteriia bacterium]
MRTVTVALILIALTFSTASAQKVDDRLRNAAERARDHRELDRDRQQLRDDLHDLAGLDRILVRHERAVKAGDRAELQAIDRQVAAMLAAEVDESGDEARAARQEVRQSKREVRSDRRELREDRRTDAGPRQTADDRRDRRDDRRDVRDDRGDAAREQCRHRRYVAIARQWNALGADDQEQRTLLLKQLRTLAQAEVADDRDEQSEDRRELREDRRESREDRRER